MLATISELTSSTIMIIDDIPINIRVARAHLETAGYLNFITLSDPAEALTAIRNANPDVLLLDIMMPGISGLEILQALRAEPETQRLPILILTGADSRDLKNQALRLGATDFLTKPIDVDELLPRVRNSLLVKSYEDDLRAQVDQRTVELEQSQNELIHCLARAAEFRDSDTGAHIVRVGKYAAIIADELGMPPEHIARLQQAATLHDVGKIGIPDSILRKEGKLNEEEIDKIQKHCGYGGQVLGAPSTEFNLSLANHAVIGAQIMEVCSSPTLTLARTIALTHHEWWDGTGYPLGLSGENIPLEGRITAVADVFDALSSRRPYKKAFSLDQCLSILDEESGSHFDPRIVAAFLNRVSDIVKVQLEHADVC
ncbi:Cyclic di-GMP phosphodiesterase response regulator RpfG [Aureliella helgolandensis]|uniref:Cyclic di-GMP phosphodiesterase response regulator RpfG n=2 Tax=Aureliella helgolandensis TaxID=2527968 RepID=A0A518G0C8_9BACT|nr:Cyclic di-GMP phosphodiesterase response regulator RpfG [Aureliella helgolandensis]